MRKQPAKHNNSFNPFNASDTKILSRSMASNAKLTYGPSAEYTASFGGVPLPRMLYYLRTHEDKCYLGSEDGDVWNVVRPPYGTPYLQYNRRAKVLRVGAHVCGTETSYKVTVQGVGSHATYVFNLEGCVHDTYKGMTYAIAVNGDVDLSELAVKGLYTLLNGNQPESSVVLLDKERYTQPTKPKQRKRSSTMNTNEIITLMQLEAGAKIVKARYLVGRAAPQGGEGGYSFKNVIGADLSAGDLVVVESQDGYALVEITKPDVAITDVGCDLAELKHVVAEVRNTAYCEVKDAEAVAYRRLAMSEVTGKLQTYRKQMGDTAFGDVSKLLGSDTQQPAQGGTVTGRWSADDVIEEAEPAPTAPQTLADAMRAAGVQDYDTPDVADEPPAAAPLGDYEP